MQRVRGISRRALFGAGAGVAATAAFGLRAGTGGEVAEAAGPVAKRSLLPPERIGLQLYSLRDTIAEVGFAKVLESVAEIGFRQVEFAGYTQGSNPEITLKELRALLDANGLVAAASHVSPSDDASMAAILDEAAALGIPRVGVSLTAPDGPPTVSGWEAAAEQYNAYGEMAAKRGVRFYLHNHFQEWLPTADDPSRRGMDVMLAATDPALVDFELDIFWAYCGRAQAGGGFDPLQDYAIPHRNRIPMFHVKDGRPAQTLLGIQDVGEGEIDFQEFFTALFAVAPDQDQRHIYLWERDNASDHPRGPLAAARTSYVNMRHALFVPAPKADADCPPATGFSASVLKTRLRRGASGRRVLRVTLEATGAADVSARLTRGRRRLAATTRRLEPGTHTIDLALPRTAPAGAATLSLTVSDGGAVSFSLREPVTIPRRSR